MAPAHLEATAKKASPATERFFYGWVIVGVSALGLFFSGPGQTYSVSTFIDYWIDEFSWSRTQVSSLYSAASLLAGMLMTLVGRLVDRHGARLALTGVALLFALTCAYMSKLQSLPMLFAGVFLIRLMGQGSLTLIPQSLVPQWFVRRRGKAIALLSTGAVLSSALFPYFNLLMIQAWGWRTAWQVWGALLALLLAPIAWRWTRNRPEDLGLLPDGTPRPDKAKSPAEAAGSVPAWIDENALTLSQVLRARVFWMLLAVTMIPSMVTTGSIFHHMSIMGENGIPPETAALVFTIAAVMSFPATLLGGAACDRWPVRYVLVTTLLILGISTASLVFVTGIIGAVGVGATRGMASGLISVTGGVVWPAYFGRRHLGTIRGIATTAMVTGSALGPLPFGYTFDVGGSYVPILWIMTGACILGAIVAFLCQPPKARQRQPLVEST